MLCFVLFVSPTAASCLKTTTTDILLQLGIKRVVIHQLVQLVLKIFGWMDISKRGLQCVLKIFEELDKTCKA